MKKITLLLLLICCSQFSWSQLSCTAPAPLNTAGLYIVPSITGAAPALICAPNGPLGTNAAGMWYTYTPSQNYTVTLSSNISQNNPLVDTRVHVYSGTCANLTCYAGDDDSGANYSSVVTFTAIAGSTYTICWDNRWSSNGFTFQLIEGAYVPPTTTPITYTSQSISTINSSYNICVVDMNGDYLDDIVGVSSNNLKVHFQTTPGNFTVTTFPISGTSKMPSWSMAAGDYNRDGFNDLVLGGGNGLSLWRSNETGTAYTNITPGQYIFCQRTNFVDINNDGNLDVFSCHDVAPNVYYLNDGNANMTYYQSGVTAGAYSLGTLASGGNYASLWSDFDNDGDLDLFISKCSGPPCELHRNEGGGSYTDVAPFAGLNVTPVQSWSSAIADFDNDGDMDIIIGSNGNVKTKFFRNNLDGASVFTGPFTEITLGSGWDTDTSINRDYVAYDFDNDGRVDVFGGGNKIMFNQGGNVFVPVSYGFNVGAIGDLNNDGFLDIQNGNTIRYAVPNNNKWLKVTLRGVQSNRNGIGARVEIYGPFGKQIRDIRSGEGFAFMSTLNAHFGLGASTVITQVIIRWPSGTIDTIINPSVNQTLYVVEGSTLSLNQPQQSVFSLYPNPATDVLNIGLSHPENSITDAQIYDLAGRLVISVKDAQQISVQDLSKGTYIIRITDNDGRNHTSKFIKE
jgi:hypothetical protein